MRNYVRFWAHQTKYQFGTSDPQWVWFVGRTELEGQTYYGAVQDQEHAVIQQGGVLLDAYDNWIYIELSQDNLFWIINSSGLNDLLDQATTNPRPFLDGSGGDMRDNIVFESPRGAERRKFRLVPIKRKSI